MAAVLKPSRARETVKAQQLTVKKGEQEGIEHIEFSMTCEYKHPRKGNYWIKFGASITPRPDELPEDAKLRLMEFVYQGLEEQIEEIKA